MLDAAELGFSPDDEQCQELAEEIGSAPPWSLASLKGLFDHRFPGWDAAPALNLSSPLSRLRGLAEVFPCDRRNSQSEGDALRELAQEVKHAQIRVMCPRPDSDGNLQDECKFLLVILGQVGDRLLVERETRQSERQVAEVELSRMREDLRRSRSEAVAAAKDQTKAVVDEMTQEAEVQRKRADKMEKELAQLHSQEQYVSGMENKIEVLESEVARSKQVHEKLIEELCEVKAQRSALAVAHEESEGALDDMQRRIDAANRNQIPSEAPSTEVPPVPSTSALAESKVAEPVDVSKTKAFTRGARTALSLQSSTLFDAWCRPVFLAWRCARLQGLRDKEGNALLEVELSRMRDDLRRQHSEALAEAKGQSNTLAAELTREAEVHKIRADEMEKKMSELHSQEHCVADPEKIIEVPTVEVTSSSRQKRFFKFCLMAAAVLSFWVMILLKEERVVIDGPWHMC